MKPEIGLFEDGVTCPKPRHLGVESVFSAAGKLSIKLHSHSDWCGSIGWA